MLRATLKGLLGHKARLALTLVAIVLGVAFVAGTFVFTDTIGNAFDDLFTDVYDGVDIEIAAAVDDDLAFLQAGRLPADLLDQIRDIDAVEAAWGTVVGYAQLVSPEGDPVTAGGAPTFGFSWPDGTESGPFRLRDGRPPQNEGEIVVDAATARRIGYAIGDRVDVLLSGPTRSFMVVGIAGFGDAASPGGATAVVFDTATAQQLLADGDVFDSISVVATAGTDLEQLRSQIERLLPEGTSAKGGADAAAESAQLIKDQLGVITTIILVFAGISLFVGGFIIQNTFRIVIAQRTRELALLRALGATRAQINRMVVTEAAAVGLLGSILGVAGGVGLAFVLRSVFEAAGASFPQGQTEVAVRTIVAGLASGVIVTTASALLPARKAAAIPPVAALSQVTAPPSRRSLRARGLWGGSLLAFGVGAIAVGLFVDTAINNLQLVGLGAAVGFVGIAVLGPVFSATLAGVVARPLQRLLGVPGRLARDNAMRSPRRTAATASALMVGITLIAGIFILASSLQRTFFTVIDRSFSADFAIQQETSGFPPLGISPTVADRLEQLPELDVVTRIRGSIAKVEDSVTFVGAVEPSVTEVFALGVPAGTLSDLVGVDTIAVRIDEATESGLGVGDSVRIEFAETGERSFRVVALWDAEALQSGYLLSLDAFRANFVEDLDTAVYVTIAAGVDPSAARAAIETVTDEFATATVFNTAEFRDNAVAQLDQLLAVVFGLLALAIFISFWGITNTLALSVFERTREIGVLRAIGMTRAQVRGMVRWEAVIVSLLGAILGIVAGIALGWAIVRALAEDGILFSVPIARLAVVVAAAAVAGVVAAAYPTIRASRLNVIEAVAYE